MARRRGREWWDYMVKVICVHPVIPEPQTPLTIRERAAVEYAIAQTKRRTDGEQRLTLIRLMYWDQTHSVSEAADALGISWETARHWSADFIKATAYGFFDGGIAPIEHEDPYKSKRRT